MIAKFNWKLETQLDQTIEVVRNQKELRDKREDAIRSFVGCWFEITEENVETCFPTTSHMPRA